MKIIVTSDIHGNREIINKLLYEFDADMYLDCGDSELSDYDLKNFYSVRGNCDYSFFPRYKVVNVNEDLNIFMTHGHLYSINEMIELAKQNNCKVILHGHTHIKKHDIIDGIHILNPGSINKPRNKESNTFLEIEYNENDKKISFQFIKLIL